MLLFAGVASDCGGQVVGYDPDALPLPDGPWPVIVDAAPDVEPEPTYPCSEVGKLVYVISHDERLYRFDPPSRQFTLVATIECPGPGYPFSMAVSRKDIAYVLYYEPSPSWTCVGLNAVNIDTGECLGQTDFRCDNPAGFQLFGMGYATDGPDTDAETLYISAGWSQSPSLAALDPEEGTVTPIAQLPSQSQAEMTGNSRGELWGFFGWDEPKFLARIDKANGALSDVLELPQLVSDQGTAVAHWGGDFFFFWSAGSSGDVYRVSGGSVSHHATFPFQVVGAGVSTCAPEEMPPVDAGAP